MKLPPCPRCGKSDDVYINCQAYGWAQQYYELDTGEREHFVIDNVLYRDSAAIHCASCQAIRRDLAIVNEKVQVTM